MYPGDVDKRVDMYEKHEPREYLELASAEESRVGIDRDKYILYNDAVRWIYDARCECWVTIKAIGARIRVRIGVKRGTLGGHAQRNILASFLYRVAHSLGNCLCANRC